jgi:hypothetical protein
MPETGLAHERCVFRAVAHIEAPEEIIIPGHRIVPALIGLEILKVSFDHGAQVAHLSDKKVLSLYHAVDDLVK